MNICKYSVNIARVNIELYLDTKVKSTFFSSKIKRCKKKKTIIIILIKIHSYLIMFKVLIHFMEKKKVLKTRFQFSFKA